MRKYLYLVLLIFGCTQIESFQPSPPNVVWQSKNHIAFPSIEKLANGEIVCVFRHGKGHVSPDGTILLCRSKNNGKSWSVPDTIINTQWDARYPAITIISDGSLLLTFFQSKYNSSGKIIGSIGTFVTRSLDGGQTWFSPKMVIMENYKWTAVSSKIIETQKGWLLLPIYAEKEGEKQKSIVVVSQDNGKTWGKNYVIAFDSTGQIDFQEPALVELENGRILCVLRTAGDNHFLHKAYSDDGGLTWGPSSRTNIQGQAAGLLKTDDNILVCGYRDFSPNATSFSYSYNEGQTFENEKIISLFDKDRAYPELITAGERQLAVFYEAQKGESKILISSFKIARPAAPSGVTVSLEQDSTVTIGWKKVANAHYYKVYSFVADSNKIESKPEHMTIVTKNTFNDKKVKSGHTYIYRIKAVASQSELKKDSGAESRFSTFVDIQL
jgi:sialidase-1